MGPLAGLAIGAGLGALFSGGGFGGGMGGILMALIAVAIVMFLLSLFRSKQPMRYATAHPPYGNSASAQQPVMNSGAYVGTASNIPPGFPVEEFLRSAKISFIRLQAANDSKDLNDIREYTTPEMFAEISMQLQERDATPQRTSVLSLNGDLLQVVTESDLAIASVRFTGQLSENNSTPESVDEIWHVQKNLRDDHSAWLLAGIQQTTSH
jgi:predicted lipid-binding transport protein (Tim44 family)